MSLSKNRQYPWERYWVPFGANFLPDSNGFPSLRSSDYNNSIIVQTLSDLDEIPCLVLLGEPGIGKTTEIEQYKPKGNDLLCQVKLNVRSSETALFSSIEAKPEFDLWLKTDKRLYLFLDGLDEAFLNIKTIHHAILEWLNSNKRKFKIPSKPSLPNQHLLFLRITCRSAMWHPETTKNLEDIFEPENVRVLKLALLTQKNVREAANCHNLDEQEFIDSIISSDSVSFASEPITLNFLIQSYKSGRLKGGGQNKSKIYHDGCLQLCSEVNPEYKSRAQLTALQRFKVAARIAALTMLTKKSFIWNGDLRIELNEIDLAYDDIVGDSYKIEGDETIMSLSSIHETINTALFTLHDSNRITFKHKTFAEFLAAWHLTSIQVPLNNLEQYITSPHDYRKVIPQVQEMAIWLATMNQDVFNLLLQSDPFLVLRIKREKTDKEKFDVVASLLKLSSQFEVIDSYEFDEFYSTLKHQKLHLQLRKIIREKNENLVTRRIAVKIAGACREQLLVNSLLIALSFKNERIHLKRNIIDAIAAIGNSSDLISLQAYALTDQDDDYDDELKGAALNALYPSLLSTNLVLQNLTKPKRNNFYGSYKSFLDNLPRNIPPKDFDETIKLLITDDKFRKYQDNAFEDLIERLIERIWDHPLTIETTDLFARLILRQIDDHLPFYVSHNDQKRKSVLEKVIDLIEDPRDIHKVFDHFARGSRLINPDDWSWVVAQVRRLDNNKFKYANALYQLLDLNNTSQLNEFLELVYSIEGLKLNFKELIGPIEIDSDRSKMLRQLSTPRKSIRKNELIVPEFASDSSRIEKCQNLLSGFSEDKLDNYWKLIYEISIERSGGSRFTVNDFAFDIVKLPFWGKLTQETHAKIVSTSKVYIEKFKPKSNWIFTEKYNRKELAGYKALLLLISEDIDFVKSLPFSFWEKWHPIIVYCSLNSLNELPENQKIILKLCGNANENNEKYYQTIYKLLQGNLDKKRDLFDLHKIREVTNEKIIKRLIKILSYENCSDRSQEYVLDYLFELNSSTVNRFSKTLFRKLVSNQIPTEKRGLAIIASTRLLIHSTASEWDWVWQRLKGKNSLARTIFVVAAPSLGYGWTRHLKLLDAEQKAEVLTWLYRNFPPQTDEIHNSTYTPSARDYVQEYRSQILRSLIEEGSIASVSALKKVSLNLPEVKDFRWWLLSAREAMRRNTWMPPTPQELKISFRNTQRRFIRSEKELLEVVFESLIRFQRKLKGNSPMANFVWNYSSTNKNVKEKPSPKDENSLSDLVKIHLDYDLLQRNLVINREVEIKRSTGNRDGERTDIYVQALSNHDDKLSLVIEVKGCWNPDIPTSMETQLKNRYLSKYKSSVGIYLVGWYYCAHYPAPLKHKNKKKFIKKINEQAISLCDERVTIKGVVLDCTI